MKEKYYNNFKKYPYTETYMSDEEYSKMIKKEMNKEMEKERIKTSLSEKLANIVSKYNSGVSLNTNEVNFYNYNINKLTALAYVKKLIGSKIGLNESIFLNTTNNQVLMEIISLLLNSYLKELDNKKNSDEFRILLNNIDDNNIINNISYLDILEGNDLETIILSKVNPENKVDIFRNLCRTKNTLNDFILYKKTLELHKYFSFCVNKMNKYHKATTGSLIEKDMFSLSDICIQISSLGKDISQTKFELLKELDVLKNQIAGKLTYCLQRRILQYDKFMNLSSIIEEIGRIVGALMKRELKELKNQIPLNVSYNLTK